MKIVKVNVIWITPCYHLFNTAYIFMCYVLYTYVNHCCCVFIIITSWWCALYAQVYFEQLKFWHQQRRFITMQKSCQPNQQEISTLNLAQFTQAHSFRFSGRSSAKREPVIRGPQPGVSILKIRPSNPAPWCAARVPCSEMDDPWRKSPNKITPKWIYQVNTKGPRSEAQGLRIGGPSIVCVSALSYAGTSLLSLAIKRY